MPARTGYLFDQRFLLHDTGTDLFRMPSGIALEPVDHPSSIRITRRTHALISGSGILARMAALETKPAGAEDLQLYHTPAHIDRIRELARSGGGEGSTLPAESAPVAPGSWEAATLAVGGGMTAVDAVLEGRIGNAYGLLRPPGHHAMPGDAMGYCIFNNIVIAARHAVHRHGLERVMIVDWDVHHGNGTQHAFYADPNVLFISLHQDDWYPAGWGKVEQVGEGDAAGRTVNIPLPAGTGNAGYLDAFERVIGPVARQFRPELILISAGQDPSMSDPNGRMLVTTDGFRAMAAFVRELADELCSGRLVALQEGGYSPTYVPFCTLAVIEGLLGERTDIQDPYEGTPEIERARRERSPWQTAAVDAVIAAQQPYWELSNRPTGR